MKSLYIVGAGGFGREVFSWLKALAEWGHAWEFAGFVDDNAGVLAGKQTQAVVVSSLADFRPARETLIVCAIGDPAMRLKVCRELMLRGVDFLTLIHPSAVVGDNCVLGRGCILCPGAVITANVRLGNFVIVNVHSSIGHDAVVGDGVTLSGHVDITGCVEVGEGAFFGTHATTLPGAKIGAYARIGAGSVVLRRVKAGATVMGVPAKQILP